jgi:hypothetical protein
MKNLLGRSVLSCPHGHLLPTTVLGADDDMSASAFSQLCSAGVHSMPVSAGKLPSTSTISESPEWSQRCLMRRWAMRFFGRFRRASSLLSSCHESGLLRTPPSHSSSFSGGQVIGNSVDHPSAALADTWS